MLYTPLKIPKFTIYPLNYIPPLILKFTIYPPPRLYGLYNIKCNTDLADMNIWTFSSVMELS